MNEPAAVLSEPLAQPNASSRPSKLGLWILTAAMAGSYLIIQLLVTIPVLLWLISTKQLARRQEALDSPAMILTALIAVAVASTITIVVALVWPRVWRAVTHQDGLTVADWVGWRPTRGISIWMIIGITPFVIGGLSVIVQLLVRDSGQNLQVKLFQNNVSRILASVIVSTLVPVAEELIFRGALFNALMPSREGLATWQRNLVPVIVTGVVFAAIHRFTGIDTLSGMIQITILSFYLSGLRAVTGSVKASMAAHFTWNLLAALALSAISMKV